MNDDRRLHNAYKNADPPPVSDEQWEQVWEDLQQPTRVEATPRSPWAAWMRYAAVFILGLAIGAGNTLLSDSAPVEQATETTPSATTPEPATAVVKSDEPAQPARPPEKDEGLELLGLKKVTVKTIGKTEDGRDKYQMRAETPNGIPVVWDYTEL